MIPYKLDVVMNRWPWMNLALIAGTTLVSFWGFTVDSDESNAVLNLCLWHGENFRFHQLITSMFMHADIFHLAGNMLMLFVFGNAVNAKLGQIKYLLVYLLAGLAANLAWMAIGHGTVEFAGIQIPIHSLGASGAIMGIVGAVLILYPRNDVSIYFSLYLFYGRVIEVSVGWLILLYVGLDVWGSLGQRGGGVNYIAHVAGALVGIGAVGALVWTNIVESAPNEENIFQVFGYKPKIGGDDVSPEEAYAATHGRGNFTPRKPAPPLQPAKPVLKSYLIHGSDRASGFKTQFEVKAKDLATARALAEKEDVIPERIVEVLS